MQPRLDQSAVKIQELESLRGMAALLVLFYHIPQWNDLLDIGIIKNSYLMVDLFFILSGFVIYTVYSPKIHSTNDLYRFQFLRFGRLYPVHLVFLSAFLLIEIAKYFAERKLGLSNVRASSFSVNTPQALIEQLFLLQAVLSNNAATFNSPAWSISVEFYTYFLFGLLVLVFKDRAVKIFASLALISLFILTMNHTPESDNLLRCLAGFFIGCLTAQTNRQSNSKPNRYFSITVLLFIILFLQVKSPQHLDILIYFLVPPLIFSIVRNRNGFLNKILNARILVWLGAISYSLYMSHSLVIWGVANIFKRVLQRPETLVDGIYVLQLTPLETAAACFTIITAVLLLSQMTYMWIEKPFRQKSRCIAFGRNDPPPSI